MSPSKDKGGVEDRLVKQIKLPESLADIPVLGEYFSQLAYRFLKISEDEQLMLANVFQVNAEGSKQLKLHNPFVETAIFNMIEPELIKLLKAAAAEKKKPTLTIVK